VPQRLPDFSAKDRADVSLPASDPGGIIQT
jgi:hypothetical protein